MYNLRKKLLVVWLIFHTVQLWIQLTALLLLDDLLAGLRDARVRLVSYSIDERAAPHWFSIGISCRANIPQSRQ